MKEEITAGLSSALEHGTSLEEAVQSFINAGYNPSEVKSSADSMSSGATSIVQGFSEQFSSKPTAEKSSFNIDSTVPEASQQPGNSYQQERKSGSKKTIIIVLLIVLLIALGAGVVLAYFFGDKLLTALFG